MPSVEDLQRQRSQALRLMTETPGWDIFERHVEEQIGESVSSLAKMMMKTPEKVTGKTAYKLGISSETRRRDLDWVYEEIDIGERP